MIKLGLEPSIASFKSSLLMSKFEEIFLLNLFRNRPLKTTAKRPRSRPTRRLRPRRPKRSGNVGAGRRREIWRRSAGRRREANRGRAESLPWRRTQCPPSASSCRGVVTLIRFNNFFLPIRFSSFSFGLNLINSDLPEHGAL